MLQSWLVYTLCLPFQYVTYATVSILCCCPYHITHLWVLRATFGELNDKILGFLVNGLNATKNTDHGEMCWYLRGIGEDMERGQTGRRCVGGGAVQGPMKTPLDVWDQHYLITLESLEHRMAALCWQVPSWSHKERRRETFPVAPFKITLHFTEKAL